MKTLFSVPIMAALIVVLFGCDDLLSSDSTPPGEVIGLSADVGDTFVTLSWVEPSDADLEKIKLSYVPGGLTAVEVSQGTTSYTFTGLLNGTEYTFIAQTIDSAGNISSGASVQATPNGQGSSDSTPPGDVSGLTATAGSTQVILSWTEPGDADFSEVWITYTPGGDTPIVVAKGTTTRTITGLTNGTSYTFTVRAVDSSDNDSAGVSEQATPYLPGGSWAQVTGSAGWAPRGYHKCLVYDDKIWIFSGTKSMDVTPVTDVWSTSDGATWIQATASPAFGARDYYEAIVFNDKMWIIGGFPKSNDVWWSTDGATWTQATASAAWTARYGHTCVVFQNKMWLLGGNDDQDQNDVWSSTDGISWVQETASAGWTGRYGHTSVVFDDKIWIICGDNSNYTDVWYSSDGLLWYQATADPGWSGRRGHASLVHGGYMWVLGGYFERDDIWYSSDGTTWIQRTADAAWPGRHNFGSVVFDNKMWVIGYGSAGTDLNDVWVSD